MKRKNKSVLRIISALLVITLSVGTLIAASAEGAAEVITTVITENSAPIAENLDFTTYRNVPVNGTFAAVDPDGDPVTFTILSQPKKGTIELTEDGGFVYTPKKNKKGSDSFTYAAIDSVGNTSQEASVSIKILKQSTDIVYSDMADSGAQYAALRLAEAGVLVGQQLGGVYFFSPDSTVSRGEFLAMCLEACSVEKLEDITKTGFSDDAEVPTWIKPYVATALMSGVVRGYTDGTGHVVFSSNTPITLAEATVILNNILEIADVSDSIAEDCPTWACQAASNLTTCKVISSTAYNTALTRAEAAEMLANAMDILDAREDSNSLLGWAR